MSAMDDDPAERLDWGTQQTDYGDDAPDDAYPPSTEPQDAADDNGDFEDTVSVGDEDDDDFYRRQDAMGSSQKQHTHPETTYRLAPSADIHPPATGANEHHRQSAQSGDDEGYQDSRSRAFTPPPRRRRPSNNPHYNTNHHHQGAPSPPKGPPRLQHALPKKPVGANVPGPILPPSDPYLVSATSMTVTSPQAAGRDATRDNGRDAGRDTRDAGRDGKKQHQLSPSTSLALPPDWEIKYSTNDGEPYFYNTRTQKTTWDHPGQPPANNNNRHARGPSHTHSHSHSHSQSEQEGEDSETHSPNEYRYQNRNNKHRSAGSDPHTRGGERNENANANANARGSGNGRTRSRDGGALNARYDSANGNNHARYDSNNARHDRYDNRHDAGRRRSESPPSRRDQSRNARSLTPPPPSRQNHSQEYPSTRGTRDRDRDRTQRDGQHRDGQQQQQQRPRDQRDLQLRDRNPASDRRSRNEQHQSQGEYTGNGNGSNNHHRNGYNPSEQHRPDLSRLNTQTTQTSGGYGTGTGTGTGSGANHLSLSVNVNVGEQDRHWVAPPASRSPVDPAPRSGRSRSPNVTSSYASTSAKHRPRDDELEYLDGAERDVRDRDRERSDRLDRLDRTGRVERADHHPGLPPSNSAPGTLRGGGPGGRRGQDRDYERDRSNRDHRDNRDRDNRDRNDRSRRGRSGERDDGQEESHHQQQQQQYRPGYQRYPSNTNANSSNSYANVNANASANGSGSGSRREGQSSFQGQSRDAYAGRGFESQGSSCQAGQAGQAQQGQAPQGQVQVSFGSQGSNRNRSEERGQGLLGSQGSNNHGQGSNTHSQGSNSQEQRGYLSAPRQRSPRPSPNPGPGPGPGLPIGPGGDRYPQRGKESTGGTGDKFDGRRDGIRDRGAERDGRERERDDWSHQQGYHHPQGRDQGYQNREQNSYRPGQQQHQGQGYGPNQNQNQGPAGYQQQQRGQGQQGPRRQQNNASSVNTNTNNNNGDYRDSDHSDQGRRGDRGARDGRDGKRDRDREDRDWDRERDSRQRERADNAFGRKEVDSYRPDYGHPAPADLPDSNLGPQGIHGVGANAKDIGGMRASPNINANRASPNLGRTSPNLGGTLSIATNGGLTASRNASKNNSVSSASQHSLSPHSHHSRQRDPPYEPPYSAGGGRGESDRDRDGGEREWGRDKGKEKERFGPGPGPGSEPVNVRGPIPNRHHDEEQFPRPAERERERFSRFDDQSQFRSLPSSRGRDEGPGPGPGPGMGRRRAESFGAGGGGGGGGGGRDLPPHLAQSQSQSQSQDDGYRYAPTQPPRQQQYREDFQAPEAIGALRKHRAPLPDQGAIFKSLPANLGPNRDRPPPERPGYDGRYDSGPPLPTGPAGFAQNPPPQRQSLEQWASNLSPVNAPSEPGSVKRNRVKLEKEWEGVPEYFGAQAARPPPPLPPMERVTSDMMDVDGGSLAGPSRGPGGSAYLPVEPKNRFDRRDDRPPGRPLPQGPSGRGGFKRGGAPDSGRVQQTTGSNNTPLTNQRRFGAAVGGTPVGPPAPTPTPPGLDMPANPPPAAFQPMQPSPIALSIPSVPAAFPYPPPPLPPFALPPSSVPRIVPHAFAPGLPSPQGIPLAQAVPMRPEESQARPSDALRVDELRSSSLDTPASGPKPIQLALASLPTSASLPDVILDGPDKKQEPPAPSVIIPLTQSIPVPTSKPVQPRGQRKTRWGSPTSPANANPLPTSAPVTAPQPIVVPSTIPPAATPTPSSSEAPDDKQLSPALSRRLSAASDQVPPKHRKYPSATFAPGDDEISIDVVPPVDASTSTAPPPASPSQLRNRLGSRASQPTIELEKPRPSLLERLSDNPTSTSLQERIVPAKRGQEEDGDAGGPESKRPRRNGNYKKRKGGYNNKGGA